VTTTNLPSGILIGDQEGIRADTGGYYYIDARGLMPGDVRTKTIVIQNLSHSDNSAEGALPYTLSMTSEEISHDGPADLLEKVKLELKLDGVIIYSGPSRGDGTPDFTLNALPLGDFEVGDRKTLVATLTVDSDLTISDRISEADFRWRFYALKTLRDVPPKTGLTGFLEKHGYILPICGLILLYFILLPLKQQRDRRNSK
jgi:hypothetical protein